MHLLSGKNIGIHLFILALIATSLACNTPNAIEAIAESAVEKCYIIDREKYESYAAQLGQAPEKPKYPESAVYEVCFIDRKLSQVRMSEGYRPEEENENLAGTYTGESDWHLTPEKNYLEPVCTEKSVKVVIASDGTVQGEFLSICTALEEMDNGENRATYHSELTGVIQGELLDVSGQLTGVFTWHAYLTAPKWETTVSDTTSDFEYLYNVDVSNGVMTFAIVDEPGDYGSFVLYKE